MNNEKHLTILSILFLTFDSILFFLGIGFIKGISLLGPFINNVTASTVVSTVGTFVGSILLFIAIPGIIAGIGLIYRKSWSRILALIICVIKLLNIPFGTMIGIYGIWVLMQDDTIEAFNN